MSIMSVKNMAKKVLNDKSCNFLEKSLFELEHLAVFFEVIQEVVAKVIRQENKQK